MALSLLTARCPGSEAASISSNPQEPQQAMDSHDREERPQAWAEHQPQHPKPGDPLFTSEDASLSQPVQKLDESATRTSSCFSDYQLPATVTEDKSKSPAWCHFSGHQVSAVTAAESLPIRTPSRLSDHLTPANKVEEGLASSTTHVHSESQISANLLGDLPATRTLPRRLEIQIPANITEHPTAGHTPYRLSVHQTSASTTDESANNSASYRFTAPQTPTDKAIESTAGHTPYLSGYPHLANAADESPISRTAYSHSEHQVKAIESSAVHTPYHFPGHQRGMNRKEVPDSSTSYRLPEHQIPSNTAEDLRESQTGRGSYLFPENQIPAYFTEEFLGNSTSSRHTRRPEHHQPTDIGKESPPSRTAYHYSGHQIPSNAEPAHWDALGDLSRYPRPQQLRSPPSGGSPSLHAPCQYDSSSLPYSMNIESSDTTSPTAMPFRSTTTPTRRKKHGRVSSVEIIEVNSDLRNIYASQEPQTQLQAQSTSQITAPTRKASPDPSLTPSSGDDRMTLPSQRNSTSSASPFDGGRALSRRGALRCKKTEVSRPEQGEDKHDPACADASERASSGETSAVPATPKRSHRRNRTAVDLTGSKAVAALSASAPTSPVACSFPALTEPAPPSPSLSAPAAPSSKKTVRFSTDTSYAPLALSRSSSTSSTGSVLNLDDMLGALPNLPQMLAAGKPEAAEESMDEGVESALAMAAENSRRYSPHGVGAVLKKGRRKGGEWASVESVEEKEEVVVEDEGEKKWESVGPAGLDKAFQFPVREPEERQRESLQVPSPAPTPASAGTKFGHKKRSSLSNVARSLSSKHKAAAAMVPGGGHQRKVSVGDKLKGFFRRREKEENKKS
ncbi:hypothetical protein K458DRAFT_484798 [Lentithecium fluviatile CBS 122367]|uniref:Uncharacterized protein n=1 Tax=Lentithecium fluviatile CBS 122367 TaxID=1168545 RepID=A0A6G1JFG8_9PLEO|nr:hypothetical protein K458DRAFT_484798 [Lentithecium fluviatile CBS 122367]